MSRTRGLGQGLPREDQSFEVLRVRLRIGLAMRSSNTMKFDATKLKNMTTFDAITVDIIMIMKSTAMMTNTPGKIIFNKNFVKSEIIEKTASWLPIEIAQELQELAPLATHDGISVSNPRKTITVGRKINMKVSTTRTTLT